MIKWWPWDLQHRISRLEDQLFRQEEQMRRLQAAVLVAHQHITLPCVEAKTDGYRAVPGVEVLKLVAAHLNLRVQPEQSQQLLIANPKVPHDQ